MTSRGEGGRILHVLDHSLPVGDGYAFRSAEIARFQRLAGWETVHVTSPKHGFSPTAKETAAGLDFYRTAPAAGPISRAPILNQWAVVSRLRRRLHEIVRTESPRLIHVHSPCLNGLAAIPVARRHGLPIVYEVRSLWEDAAVDSGACKEGDLRYRISRSLETFVCRKVDRVVTICDGLRGELVSRGIAGARVTVAPNSVDLRRFSGRGARDELLARQMGLSEGSTFGFIGTFFPFEGLPVLLRAVPLVLKEVPDARFVLVGDGPESGGVRDLAKQLGIEEAVIFTGRVPHGEVERYYELIDVLVYPRISNRLTELVTPLKPLEAMAKGKLIVASDVGGHREMILPGQSGRLFVAGSPESLARACLDLHRDREGWPALRRNAYDYVSQARSWEKNISIYSDLYADLLAASGVRRTAEA